MKKHGWSHFLLLLSINLLLLFKFGSSKYAIHPFRDPINGDFERHSIGGGEKFQNSAYSPKADCSMCDLKTSYCKTFDTGNIFCICREGFVKVNLDDPFCVAVDLKQKVDVKEGEDACNVGEAEKAGTRILTDILTRYDRNIVPSNKGVDVDVELIVQTVSAVSEIESSVKIDLLMSMIWHDPMLNFEAYEGAHCLQNLSLSYRMVESIWNPSVCIVNSKSSRIHESPVPNVFMAIFSNGTVWINYRIALESPCEFDFSLFPMDRIVCSLHIESYSFNVGKCRLHWKRVGVPIVIEEIRLPDFTHTKYTHEKKNYFYPAGDWDRLQISIFFKRDYPFYILNIILPSYIMVLISFLSFFIDRQQLPARITLTISSLMSLTLQNANVSKQLPKVSYLKAIDVFMFTNIGYIFLSIVELAVVGMLEKEKKDLEMKEKGKRFTFAKGIAKSMTKSFRDRSSKTNRHHHVLTAAPSDPDSYTRNLWTRELAKTSTFHQVQQPDPIDDATLSLTKSKELERRKNIFKSSNESDKQSNQKSRTNSTTFVQKWNSEDMDKLARKVFPLSYCCVNLVYWMYVTAKAQEGA